MSKSSLYWVGNIAKSRVIDDILKECTPKQSALIFDYGCGDGGDWPAILRENPWLRLVCYEPFSPSYKKAARRLHGKKAKIFGGNDIETLSLQADYIVSFSVFEHVVNRSAFLHHAKRLLAPKGKLLLNYDDGHFRNHLDITRPTSWLPTLRSFLRTIVSPALATFGFQSGYQRRVSASELDTLVRKAGFYIERVDYQNLPCLKNLIKTLPPRLHQDYAAWWLQTEMQLNKNFRLNLSTKSYGDNVNLWAEMASRTVHLRHS